MFEALDRGMSASRAFSHPLLAAMRSDESSPDGVRGFAVQWYKAATAHKKAFPGLVYNIKDDEVRLGLIDILHEEYGFGELANVHARLLGRFLVALGIDTCDADRADAAKGVAYFSTEVDKAWVSAHPDFAYGVHYALEFLAANMHKAFYANVSRLGLADDAVIYFKLHSTVEVEHAAKARRGLELLGTDDETRKRLADGVERGTQLVESLLDGLEEAYRGTLH